MVPRQIANERYIHIIEASQNNLQSISLHLPREQLIAITGVSGSGKSSLAMEVLYAEGQRRYVETFSPYARQFLERLDRPRVREIIGIPPAIAIPQGNPVKSSRSTVGTMTEISDYLKLLYARKATLHCEKCGQPVQEDSPESIWQAVAQMAGDGPAFIVFPLYQEDDETARRYLHRHGFRRFLHQGLLKTLEEDELPADRPLDIVVDRVTWTAGRKKRILDSLELALHYGNGRATVITAAGERRNFSTARNCPNCNIAYPPVSPHLFSFNSPLGACETCRGFGRIIDVDLDLVIPDRNISLAAGAIRPWGTRRGEYYDLMDFCRSRGIPTDVPFKQLSPEQQQAVIDEGDEFYGVRGFFRWLEGKTYKMHVRVFLSRYRAYLRCPACGGSRLKPLALLYRCNGVHIGQLNSWSIDRSLAFLKELTARYSEDPAASLVCSEVVRRLSYLVEVGLGYLTLDRQSRTLAGGEVQRVHLTRALGSPLVNTLYVLDEPSVGLHPRDNHRLTRILKALTAQGNTVVVVEHEPTIIQQTDYLVDLGPDAGECGGKVVYAGPTSGICQATESRTACYLTSGRQTARRLRRRPRAGRWLHLKGIRVHNLRNIQVDIPLGLLVAVTGVSGSGKSTLVEDVLYRNWLRYRGVSTDKPGYCADIRGFDLLSDVVLVDQQPIGRTPRANLLTYSGALSFIRRLYANTAEAKLRGYGPAHFSFNTAAGRCEACRGEGYERVEMQFLADLYLRCPACQGKRYRQEVLDILYRGRSIGDLLDLTLQEAVNLFADQEKVAAALQPLQEVGLNYLRLGQPLNTLSGGESQRLKLARSLKEASKKGALLLLDEPTTGLHGDDVGVLLEALHRLVQQGQSVVVVEHNLEVIDSADYVIDLGPEGGDRGGEIVAAGTPEQVAESEVSHTGRFLRLFRQGRSSRSMPIQMPRPSSNGRVIKIRGAREHNLQGLSLDLPRDQLVVITGVSGSGKTTLAFDILFAEGQRRYLDSLSTYARQYLPNRDRPEADEISGVPPTVAIDQRSSLMGPRSTVATITEIYHYLRLLYSKVGEPYCPQCGDPISVATPEVIAADLYRIFLGKPLVLLAPKVTARKGYHREVLKQAKRQGYDLVRVDGRLQPLDPMPIIRRFHEHDIEVVVQQWPELSEAEEDRLKTAVREALLLSDGTVIAWDGKGFERYYSKRLTCARCHLGFPTLDPRLFSFNSRHGACQRCEGLGRLQEDGREVPCPQCRGARLNKFGLNVRIHGSTIWDVCRQSVKSATHLLKSWRFHGREAAIVGPAMEEIVQRLQFLQRVGLGYLQLHRAADSLSGGEAQRIRLAAQLGSNLRGVCYILDEPTIGLHPCDNERLLETLVGLKNKGNTIVVVEHDEETIRKADYLIDLGPGAGRFGGRLVAQGSLADLRGTPESVTGAYLNGRGRRRLTSRRRGPRHGQWLIVRGARARNLRNLEVAIPLGTLTCVTGVSGSGKSTLVEETLFKALSNELHKTQHHAGEYDELLGWQNLHRVVRVDHSPIGRTPRSVPATYVGIFAEIRRLFAATAEARARGYTAGRFSFNVAAGRCPECKGQGLNRVEMAFLPDIYVRCLQCNSSRYNSETLAVRYKGKNIAQVLAMTVEEAAAFFAPILKISRPLDFMLKLGLGYLSLGQPSPTLSGGEAQRIKLVQELAGNRRARTIYFLDEPTTGLHIADVERLVAALQTLVDAGHTVVVIEHNLEVIKAADYVIDLGPGGGDEGGRLVASGSPEELLQCTAYSHTARHLQRYLEGD
ncbi:MAG: excinuclease ABC subunit UvrA [Deltaproteobacteria bacterium]|nr:excinuclease ABC subunit UvrA [Deltaproteobacteria bacterium]